MSNPPPPESPDHCRQLFQGLQSYQSDLRQVMHDGLCQSLGSALLMARTMASRPPADALTAFQELDRLLTQTVENSRELAHKLSPLNGRPEALMTALAELAASSAIPCEFVCEDPCLVRDETRALAIYRLAEAAISLVNTEKRGPLTLTLARAGDGEMLKLQLSGSHLKGQAFLEALAIAAGAVSPNQQEKGSLSWLFHCGA